MRRNHRENVTIRRRLIEGQPTGSSADPTFAVVDHPTPTCRQNLPQAPRVPRPYLSSGISHAFRYSWTFGGISMASKSVEDANLERTNRFWDKFWGEFETLSLWERRTGTRLLCAKDRTLTRLAVGSQSCLLGQFGGTSTRQNAWRIPNGFPKVFDLK